MQVILASSPMKMDIIMI